MLDNKCLLHWFQGLVMKKMVLNARGSYSLYHGSEVTTSDNAAVIKALLCRDISEIGELKFPEAPYLSTGK